MAGMTVPLTLDQSAFRFRGLVNFDAAANASFDANDPALNTDLSVEMNGEDVIIRIRLVLQTNSDLNDSTNTGSRQYSLRWSKNGGAYSILQTGSEQPIEPAGTGVAFADGATCNNTAVGGPTGSGSLRSGQHRKTASAVTNTWEATGEQWGPSEWAIRLKASWLGGEVQDGDFFDFRIYWTTSGTELDSYTNVPRATISLPAAPFDLTEAALLKHGRGGPFIVGSDLYAAMVNAASPSVVGVLKSEDGGTNWSTVGDLIELSNDCVAIAATVDGSGNIHIAHQEASTGSRIGYSRFATGTDTMSVNNTQIDTSAIDIVTSGDEVVTIDVDGSDIIVGATYVDISVGQATTFYHSNNSGSSWTQREPYADIRVGACPIGDTGTVHFLALTLSSLASQTWNSYGAGTNDSYNDIESYSPTPAAAKHMGQWLKFTDSGEFLAVPYVGPNTNVKARLVHWESIQDNPPSVSYTVVSDVSDNDVKIVTGTPQLALVRNSTGTWFLVYVDSSGAVRWVSGSFGTWNTDTASGITGANQISVQLIDDSTAGILYDDGSGVVYDEITFGDPPANLDIDDSVHATTSESPTLTQKHTLSIDSAVHAVTSDEPDLVAGATDLAIDNAVHAHRARVVTFGPPVYQEHRVTTESFGGVTAIDAAVPDDVQEEELIVAFVSWRANGAITPVEEDWSELHDASNGVNGPTNAVYVRTATASEPATYGFTFSGGTSRAVATLVRVKDHTGIADIVASSGNTTSPTAPTAEAGPSGGLSLFFWSWTHSFEAFTPPANKTKLWEGVTFFTEPGNVHQLAIVEVVPSGFTGTRVASLGGTAREWVGITLIVQPAVAPVTLSIDDSVHGHVADSADLSQKHNLDVDDSVHSVTSTEVTFSVAATLEIDDAVHAVTSEEADLTQNHELSIDDSVHNVVSDNVELTQKHELSIDNAIHSVVSDELALAQSHTLAIDDAVHSVTSDELSLSGAVSLTIDSAVHATVSDEVALTQAHTLSVASASHTLTSEQLDLGQVHQLVVDDAVHGHVASHVILTMSGQILTSIKYTPLAPVMVLVTALEPKMDGEKSIEPQMAVVVSALSPSLNEHSDDPQMIVIDARGPKVVSHAGQTSVVKNAGPPVVAGGRDGNN